MPEEVCSAPDQLLQQSASFRCPRTTAGNLTARITSNRAFSHVLGHKQRLDRTRFEGNAPSLNAAGWAGVPRLTVFTKMPSGVRCTPGTASRAVMGQPVALLRRSRLS